MCTLYNTTLYSHPQKGYISEKLVQFNNTKYNITSLNATPTNISP